MQLPVVPDELPDILQSLSNESFETNTKTLTLLGNKKPRSFSFRTRKKLGLCLSAEGFAIAKLLKALFLPTKDYDFASCNGKNYIDLRGVEKRRL